MMNEPIFTLGWKRALGQNQDPARVGPRKNIGAKGERSHEYIGMSDVRDPIHVAARTGPSQNR
jgi:hypothetical protein